MGPIPKGATPPATVRLAVSRGGGRGSQQSTAMGTSVRLDTLAEEQGGAPTRCHARATEVDASELFHRGERGSAGCSASRARTSSASTTTASPRSWASGQSPAGPSFPVGLTSRWKGRPLPGELWQNRTSAPGGRLQRPRRARGDDPSRTGSCPQRGARSTVAGRLWGRGHGVEYEAQRVSGGHRARNRLLRGDDHGRPSPMPMRATSSPRSRALIVEAGYAERRRRIGRDMHDGAQQEFVSAAVSLQARAQARVRRGREAGGRGDGPGQANPSRPTRPGRRHPPGAFSRPRPLGSARGAGQPAPR